jgi:hypothetical protein
MTIGFAEASRQEPERPEQLRLLWRMEGTRRIAAAIYRHPSGWELRAYFEPEDRDDVLRSQVERKNLGALEELASRWREALLAKGWRELPHNPGPRGNDSTAL